VEHFIPNLCRYVLALSVLLLGGTANPCMAESLRHPGILVDESMLDSTKRLISRRDESKMRALSAALSSPLSSLEYRPSPREVVDCGPYSRPDFGCSDEVRDAQAAYTHALLWAYQGDERHARKAVQIMDSWADVLSRGHKGSNAPLQASWAAQLWTRSAEIVRYTSNVWPEARAKRFGAWLLLQYLPDIDEMGLCLNGNWQASAIEARMNIGIYNDRRDIYERAVSEWREQFPLYVYMAGDGASPLARKGCEVTTDDLWYGQGVFVSGLAQETCRDLGHTAFALASFTNAAETNWIQGGTLYVEEGARLGKAMELLTGVSVSGKAPPWLCGGKLKASLDGTLEVGYGHLHGRLGMALPNTRKWLGLHRPSRGHLHFIWETLTHGVPLR